MTFPEDEEVTQTFLFDRTNPRYRERVHVGRVWRYWPKLDVFGFDDRAELLRELCIAVADDVSRPALTLLIEEHTEISRLLRHPGGIGMRRHSGHVDAPGPNVDKEQNVVFHHTPERPHVGGEKIAGPERLYVSLDEIVPGAHASFRSRIEPVLLEDPGDRCAGDLADPKLLQFSQNTLGAPRVLFSYSSN